MARPTQSADHWERSPGISLLHYLWVLVVAFGILALLCYQLNQSYEQVLNRGYDDASNQTWSLDAYLNMTLRHFGSDLTMLQAELAAENATNDWNAQRRETWKKRLQILKDSSVEIDSLWIFDAKGQMMTSTTSATKVNIADRSHFQRLRDTPDAGLIFSKLIDSRADGKLTIAVLVPLKDPSGKFNGAVTALINLQNVQHAFAAFAGNSRNTISMYSIDDHATLLRHPRLPDTQTGIPDTSYGNLIDSGQKIGTLKFVSPLDGQVHIGAFRVLDGFPFYVTVDLPREQVIAPWKREAFSAAFAALILIASLLFVFYRIRQSALEQSDMLQRLVASVADQKRQNLALAALENQHKQLLQKLQVGIVVHAADSTILFSNPRASELLGLTEDQMHGKAAIDPAWCFLNEAGGPIRVENYPVSRVITTKSTIPESILGINRPDLNSVVWVLVSAFPELNENGDLKEIVVNFHDITERKLARDELDHQRMHLAELVEERTVELSKALEVVRRSQDDLIQSERLASLGSMVAGLSHELNTPLGNTLLAATSLENLFQNILEMSQSGSFKRTSLREFLISGTEMSSLISRSSQRAADMVASFKQVAVDQTSEQRRDFELSEVIKDNLSTLMPKFIKNRYELENQIPPGILCNSYPGPLGQILTNLVQNAIVHGVGELVNGTITITAEYSGGFVKLSVSDNGRGMPPEIMEHIFDPFFTTRMGKGGSGLGLSISRRIATSILGGNLKAQSTIGVGSVFTLTFPAVAPFPMQ